MRILLLTLLALSPFAALTAATVPVTTTAPGGAGSLRNAIEDAAAGDTVVFQIPTTDAGYDSGTGYWTITLDGGLTGTTFVLRKNLIIDASGQKIQVRRASSAPTNLRIFEVSEDKTVTLIHLWISNGDVSTESVGTPARYGAGLRNYGTVTVRDCLFTGNTAGSSDGGGAIFNSGRMTVVRSTFSGNTAKYGGAIYTINSALNTIDTCTFNANTAGEGGAIYNNRGQLFLKSSTITGNAATNGSAEYGGGGLTAAHKIDGATHVENTIIVGNTGPLKPETGGVVVSHGHNLIGPQDNTSGFGGNGDQVAVTPAQASLKPLGDYGGLTPTMPPQVGSFAIDKGKRTTDANGELVSTDQRGQPRPVDRQESNSPSGDTSDIGAVEVGAVQAGPELTITTIDDHNDSECTADDCTLREALSRANASSDPNTINFARGVEGTITHTSPAGLVISNPVTLNGPGPDKIIVSGSAMRRVFQVSSQNVVISGIRIVFGGGGFFGAGVISTNSTLTLRACVLGGNVSGGSGLGGGAYNGSGSTLTLERCTFVLNQAGQFGGAIYNDGTLSATNCTFLQNTAVRGGAIITRFNGGFSRSTLRNCTITQNTATSTTEGAADGGGGFYAEGGSQQHHIGNCIIAGNINSVNPDVRGQITSDGHNLIGNAASSVGFTNNVNGDQVGTPGAVRNPQLDDIRNNGGPTETCALLSNSSAINAGDNALAPPADQRGYGRNGTSDIGAFEFQGLLPVTLANISTRLRVETGNNVLIGGFIITGTQAKKVIIRAIGPSLPFAGQLENPTLELYQGSILLASNDDWQNQPAADRQAVIDSTVPPGNDLESALVRTLPANGTAYTAIVRGVNDGSGIGVVEVFDLDRTVDSKLANISTRGLVQTGDNVLIAGTIVLGTSSQKVIVRAIAPSLPFSGTLANPTLELRDANGGLLEANDDWVSSPNKQAIIDSTVPPGNDLESAIVRTLPPASYTAVVRGVNDTTGIAVVEVYALK